LHLKKGIHRAELRVVAMTKRAAIILSGGKAERFQSEQQAWQDKALFELFGKPLLIHAVENVQNLVEEIVISVNDKARETRYSEVLKKHNVKNVRLLIDEKIDQLGGPIVAILTGLKSVKADYCFTLPCDMPLLQPKVMEYMFNIIKNSRVVVPMWPNGRLETLTMVLQRKSALEIASTLCNFKRPRSDDIIRGALNVLFVSTVGEIRALDPELKSFVNINSREDLTELQPRRVQGTITENMQLNLGTLPTLKLQRLRDAASRGKDGKFSEATRIFASCASQLERKNSVFWAAISRENEGKSLLERAQQQTEPELTIDQASGVKKALLKAADNYGLEAEMHEKYRCRFLAERARSDKAWCEAYADNWFRQVHHRVIY
jgi:molybdopterin-guanine dinucleotide biosynthesis protein A